MKMDIKNYVRARDHAISTLHEKMEVYLLYVWDPFVKYNIIKKITELIQTELIELFPDFPSSDLPKCRIRIFEDSQEVEVGIQNYYNPQNGLTYLGTSQLGDEMLDLYFRTSYDSHFNYKFIARFGHEPDDYYTGSKTAEVEYNLGKYTPLSMAYGIAIEDGFID